MVEPIKFTYLDRNFKTFIDKITGNEDFLDMMNEFVRFGGVEAGMDYAELKADVLKALYDNFMRSQVQDRWRPRWVRQSKLEIKKFTDNMVCGICDKKFTVDNQLVIWKQPEDQPVHKSCWEKEAKELGDTLDSLSDGKVV